jgi:hypothetical protein
VDEQSVGQTPIPTGGDVLPSQHEVPEPTGRPDVDAVLDRLHELDGLPPSQHVDLYEDAHRRLHETLLAAGETREHPAQPS